jgi:thiol-disulfide isomerase/thioredoxin
VAKRPPAKRPQGARRPPVPAKRGRPAGLFTWLAVGLVVIVVVGLVVIKLAGGSSTPNAKGGFSAASPAVVSELTHIPASVFNAVGVTSPVAQVTPPQALKGQPALTATSASGATLPEVFYFGAEYCPYCAAQRWPTIIALSRFGTFTGLGNMSSSASDFAGTPTFTFVKATYTSKYLVFKSVESDSNVFDSATDNWVPLQKPTAAEEALFIKYDSSKYVTGYTAQDDGSIPFISLGNKFLVAGASYTPATLANLSRNEVAAGLSEATNPVTQAIITSANEQTAAFCQLTKGQPGNVCNSSGVMAAKKLMGL